MSTRGKGKKRKPKGSPANPERSKRLVEAATALRFDESGMRLNKAMRTLLKPKRRKRRKS